MTDSLSFLDALHSPIELFDDLPNPYTQHTFSPFALTDAFIKEAGETKKTILHFWTTPPLIILGMMDTKLPFLTEALPVFEDYGYPYMVRNSGGLGIVSDDGILNISLIFPEENTRLPINDAYARMHELIQTAFESFGQSIDAYEISDSYCPGEYDLSINGKKIAGIAQRRIRGGIAVMIYLSVYGDQHKRAEMIRTFYDKGLQGQETKWNFPTVHPESMTTLTDALGQSFSTDDVKERILNAFTDAGFLVEPATISDTIHEAYIEGMEKMTTRNEKMLPQPPHRADGQ